jgi:uncharacterized protein YhfF
VSGCQQGTSSRQNGDIQRQIRRRYPADNALLLAVNINHSSCAASKCGTLTTTDLPPTDQAMSDSSTPVQAVRDFWDAFRRTHTEIALDTPYDIWHFGDDQELADMLYPLVLRGVKRAGASLLWEYERESEALPAPGNYSVITDFAGAPQCVVQTAEVQIKPYDQVDAQFAFDEGEGDRSLEYWRKAHWDYFSGRCRALGKTPSMDMPVVCERFRVVYPEPE